MDVCHAIESRRAVRGFTDEPVSRTHLEWVLSAAARAPSGANLQPWNAYVMTGALIPPPPISAIAPSGSPARTRRRATRRSPPTGPVSEHLPPSSAQSTETWARRSGPTSGCICRRSCFCSVMKDCAAATQMAWSVYRRTGAEIVSPPDDLILFCGLSIGFEDATANTSRIDRAPLAETVTFVDGQVLADHVAGRHRQ